ncbi:grasp-with-spasm system A modified peptide [Kordia algicida OT-1]|uniref:Uncharacterized protein n=1 Tax=Kordia algicida OT-1 TaxID=391587 RepID=A9DQA5_9FLAO|nr:grasp-with-spasm system A modified peptide [Kordia algicida]EDP96612.1 hypothetical protein KAOT1_15653 [Kordia algicida OT-1]
MKLSNKNIKAMSTTELEAISGGLRSEGDTATATATASFNSSAEAEAEAESAE